MPQPQNNNNKYHIFVISDNRDNILIKILVGPEALYFF